MREIASNINMAGNWMLHLRYVCDTFKMDARKWNSFESVLVFRRRRVRRQFQKSSPRESS